MNRNFFRTAAALVCLAAFLAGSELFSAPAQVPGFSSPPEIDGKLDDASWSKMEWSGGNFTHLNQPEARPTAQTWFKMGHDGNNLYLAVKLDEPKMDGLRCEQTERDGKIYIDDCVEIFLDPNGDRATYFHIAVNAKGVIRDAEGRQGGVVHDLKWQADGICVATSRSADCWTVEMSIPLVSLALDAASKGEWGFNIARERYAASPLEEFSSFVPLTGGFHQPSRFSRLVLLDGKLDAFLWEVKSPFDVRTVDRNGTPVLQAKTYVANHTGAFHFLKVSAALDSAGGGQAEETAGLDEGQGKDLEFSIPAGSNGKANLAIVIADRKTGQVMAKRSFPVTIDYSPLSIILTSPSYRNSIFATQKLAEIAGRVEANVNSETFEGKKIRLVLRGPDGAVAAEKSLPAAAASDFNLPLAKLADGDGKLSCELVDSEGKVLHQANLRIRKLPPFKGEVRIDENLVTRVDGVPFMPWGWFSIPDSEFDQGYNVVVDYNAYYRTDTELKDWLDRLHSAGIKALIYPYTSVGMSHPTPELGGQPLGDDEAEKIRGFVRKWKGHPALLAWYLGDEPELVPILPARLEAVRNVCEDEDPYHPCVMLNDSIDGIYAYINSGDVMMPDPYPLFIQGGNAASPIEKVHKFIAAVRDASKGASVRRAAWITPQAFNYGDFGAHNNRQPDFDELRNMTYQAVAEGTTGFTWWTYYQAINYPDILTGMRFLTREMRLLEPCVLAPHLSQKLATSAQEELFLADYRKVGSAEYLIAVNLSPEDAGQVSISLPQGAAAKWRAVSEDNRQLSSKDGKLTDGFGRYAVHIYTTAPKADGETSLAEARAELARVMAEHARGKPGNLASTAHGTVVKAVSGDSTKYSNRLRFLLDGVWSGIGWDTGSATGREWLELGFAKPVKIGRVVLVSHNITRASVQIPDGSGGWREIAQMNLDPDQEATVAAFRPRTLSAKFPAQTIAGLRIVLMDAAKLSGAIFQKGVMEVEAYEK